MTDQPNPIGKYTFNLYEADMTALKELVSWGDGSNVAQALHSAIATEHYLRNAARNGEKVYVESVSGQLREIVFKTTESP